MSTNSTLSSTNSASSLLTSGGPSVTYAMNLVRVVEDATNPSSVFDLVGDGSGQMGQLCVGSSTGGVGGGQEGASSCNCNYSYTVPGGGTESYQAPTTYHEGDEIRCSYSGIPLGTTQVTVSVFITTTNQYSNPIVFNFTATGTTSDPTNIANFAQVTRYQCRGLVYVPYLFGSSIYDPIQSVDPSVSYSLDYYTSNLAGSLEQYVNAQVPSYECPVLTNDPRSAAGTELRLFSHAPDSAGSVLIYPPSGSAFDRSTFYVANFQGGVFQVPVDAITAPQLTTSPGGTIPPLGYGASPISLTAGQETCPDSSVAIPAGYQWVKVWLFRADLPQLFYHVSNGISQAGGVACNVGNYPSANTPVFPDCADNGSPGLSIYSSTPLAYNSATNQTNFMADRVFNSGNSLGQSCMRLGGTSGGTNYGVVTSSSSYPKTPPYTTGEYTVDEFNTAPNTCPNDSGVGCETNTTAFGFGTDLYAPVGALLYYAPISNPLNIYPQTIPSPFPQQGASDANPAYDSNLVLEGFNGSSSSSSGTSTNFDFVYVVTPPSVMLSDMEAADSAALPYMPFRFYAASQCLSNNPSQPTSPTDCSLSNEINYGLKLYDVSGNGDPPAGNSSAPVSFPVCALQPIQN